MVSGRPKRLTDSEMHDDNGRETAGDRLLGGQTESRGRGRI